MLTINQIQGNKDELIRKLQIKNFKKTEILEEILELDKQRREIQQKTDQLQSEMNALSKEIGKLFQSGKKEEANIAKEKTTNLKDEIKKSQSSHSEIGENLNKLLVQLPNLPHESVPKGNSDEDNVVIETVSELPELNEKSQPHWDLGKKYDIIDFELGTKITGAGFPVYKGKGAKLQRALINFFLDENEKAGYREILPPLLVNEDSGFGTGQLPDKEGQMYHVQIDNLYLIPTAEVPVTNIYRDVILNEEDFPIKNTAYTPCFRREAGSYGKDVRGLNRVHQFDKVEIVQIQHPTKSYQVLDEMVAHVKSIIEKLELPFRVLRLCGGDLSFTSALTFDFEVFAAAQKRWLEVSSVSNFESYQSTRLKLRYKDKATGKNQFAHTLNGSSLALPRIVAALLENNQSEEGIKIPEILWPYTGFKVID